MVMQQNTLDLVDIGANNQPHNILFYITKESYILSRIKDQ